MDDRELTRLVLAHVGVTEPVLVTAFACDCRTDGPCAHSRAIGTFIDSLAWPDQLGYWRNLHAAIAVAAALAGQDPRPHLMDLLVLHLTETGPGTLSEEVANAAEAKAEAILGRLHDRG